MNSNNQKKLTIGLIVALITLVSGISYAYFTASFQNLGERETTITAAEMGSLKLTATEATYTSGNQYPGDMAIQKFTVEPVSKGSGVYELDLTGVIDESIFGSDVEIQLYKSLDNTEVTITEGDLTQNGTQFSRVDTLVTNGLTPIYTKALKNGLNILYQEEFEVIEESGSLKVRENPTSTSYPKYTFYLVYNYKNNGNQNNQMGQTFNGTVSGKLVKQLNGAGTIAKLAGNADKDSTAVIDNGSALDGEEVLCTNTLAYDDFGNLRYVGANPCNYVTFNNEAPTIADAYQIRANGDVSTNGVRFNGGNGYDSKEACEGDNGLSGNFAALRLEGTAQCLLNSETNKYYISATGYLAGTYESEEACLSGMQSNGLRSQTGPETYNMPSGLSCEKHGKMASGGWRIIGVFDNQIKLIRNESIGSYSWDTSASSVNSGYGINQWGESGTYTGADLMKLLNPGYDNNLAEDASGNTSSGTYANNSLYWNKQSGNCYNNYRNAYTTCDFSATGLSESSKSMIDKHTWNLGSHGENDVWTSGNGLGLASKFYEYERSNNNGKICTSGSYCNDTVNRTTTWEGYVGLMYPSDYGYAVGGEARTNCLANTNLYNYDTNNCDSNDWLYNSWQWTMSSLAGSSGASYVFYVDLGGDLLNTLAGYENSVRPALFLIPSIEISGEGTPIAPFTLSVG